MIVAIILFFVSGCIDSVGTSTVNTVSNNTNTTDTTNNTDGYTLVWSDEFDSGTTPLSSKWVYDSGYGSNGWGNDEWQNYTSLTDNVSVSNDSLVISALCPTGICGKRDGSVTSGKITTKGKYSFKYGKIQARIKTPSGQGMWPAFWMLGANIDTVGWPKSGEIDIMEMHYLHSNTSTTHSSAHWWNDNTAAWTYTTNHKTFSTPLTDDFHIYEVVWDSQSIQGKIDGTTYYTQIIDPTTMSEFQKEFYIILNVAVGGTLGGGNLTSTWPQSMVVDWVRVYQDNSSSTANMSGTTNTLIGSGIYSDQFSNNYQSIISSSDWNGNVVIIDSASGVVTPYEGLNVLAADFQLSGKGWGGVTFDLQQDWSGKSQLLFSINHSLIPGFDDLEIKLEDGTVAKAAKSIRLKSYTPVNNNSWSSYTIPLADFSGIDLANVKYLGFYSPVNVSTTLLAGTLCLDQIYLN